VTDAPTLEQAREALAEAVRQIGEKYPEVARMLDEQGEQMLGVYALPAGHRKRMRSTNMLERWFEEVRRRTQVVRIFPNRASCLRLIAAHAMEANEEWLGRRYLRMEPERMEEELAGWLAAASDSTESLPPAPARGWVPCSDKGTPSGCMPRHSLLVLCALRAGLPRC